VIYLGSTVLTVDPNRRDLVNQTFDRSKFRIDSATGPFTEYDKALIGRQLRTFNWYMGTRAAINDYKAFLAERQGRLVPFWVPTWHHDLVLAADIIVPSGSIDIQNIGYTRFLFDPLYTWRRYVAFIKIGSGIQYIRRINTAIENTDTETLTLDAAPTGPIVVDQWMLSFLTFCRLESDTVPMTWHTLTVAEAAFDMRELPQEMPTTP
jgi:hypothetical protein